ncbi:MAG TPA: hypothetical protein VGX68_10615 [Thermoanaerobaculia bacterium]|jgi:hypothetical protein|nr:hypothetical protein [Thermoanaerobaculia bacterium]
MKRGILFVALAVVLLAGTFPLAAADLVIRRGVDTFTTTASGKTFFDFADTPIPAGFFCKGAAPFTGRMTFRGLPLETGAPGQLHGADTVVERLDDAVFNAGGTAATRIQIRAMSLVSLSPIKTDCGAYHVYVSLVGQQQETTMRIFRTEENGGNFVAPLAVKARLTFIPVRARQRGPRKLQLTVDFTFPAEPLPWSTTGGARTKRLGGSALVDTNGDLIPDTEVAGTSNFWPGWSPDGHAGLLKGCTLCEPESCHTDPASGEQHCTGPVYACYPYNCP